MFPKRMLCLILVMLCVVTLTGAAGAVEVDCDADYCFSSSDFSEEEDLTGVCMLQLPSCYSGTVMLDTRVVQPGDILTAEQLASLSFIPCLTNQDREATVSYLPIYKNRVGPTAIMTISIRGKEDKAPIAEDLTLETYKNLPNQGKLKASDPEGGALTYTITRSPKRGELDVGEDGSFTYTPKKNKVGTDSFTYTATDAAGNVSRTATVIIQILKPTNKTQYSDTLGNDCRFAAEWMKNTGLFEGERINGSACFQPDKAVSRGEFIAMMIQSLGIPVDEEATCTGFTDDVPGWLKPYLAAALRSGLTVGWPHGETFGAQETISGAEAALLLQNALDLPVYTVAKNTEDPEWAAGALAAMAEHEVILDGNGLLNRGQMAMALYRASRLVPIAPGMGVFMPQ